MRWRRHIEPFTRPLFKVSSRLGRGMTLGVRGLATNAQGDVLLIEHTYIAGWYLPGGGVDRGESCEAAVARELQEEAGIRPTTRPRLLSIHDNGQRFPGDHVLVYRIEAWEPCRAMANGEIAQVGWFAPDRLPLGTSQGTRDRVEEAFNGKPPQPHW